MERAENAALAAEVFDQFCSAGTLKTILSHHRHLCSLLHIRPTNFNQFYPKLKSKLRSWKAQALWNKFDKRASHKCYNRGKACTNARVLVIGAGPCGLRAAIEAQLLGAKVVVVEKRDRITRNNVLHLWPFVIHDLRALGAKKFFGRFCAGAIDHISIRQLQCILLKVALILGIEIHEGVGFESLVPPPTQDQAAERVGWRASTSPADHPVSQYEFNILIGADGKRNTLDGFKRKEFRGKLAIAITANFINRHSEAEARVEEISGVAFIFNQKFFKELYATTGIDLENIVYYKDDTHYFVMTAKKHSLIDKGVIRVDYSDTAKLLSSDNVDKTALMDYAREAADFSTGCRLPQLEFAVNHYGQPDVAMFDFTSMYAAENASRFVEISGHTLLVTLVGDSLLEPFWPTGSGCARGFLSSMDACWAIRSWCLGLHPLEVLAERESIYRLLGQTTPENLHRDLQAYTLDPHTRYPNLNSRSVLPIQVRGLFSTDDIAAVEQFLKEPNNSQPAILPQEVPKKRRRRDGHVHAETLLHWLQRQVSHYPSIKVVDITHSFKDGLALCAIVHRYRPHLLDFAALDQSNATHNNQLAFDILERELAIPPVMTGKEMATCEVPDSLTMLTYLSQVYEAFRGEIPHIKHPKLDDSAEELVKPEDTIVVKRSSLSRVRQGHQRGSSGCAERAISRTLRRSHVRSHASLLEHDNAIKRELTRFLEKSLSESLLPKGKWYDVDWRTNPGEARSRLQAEIESRRRRLEDIERLRNERYMHRKYLRHIANQQFYKSMQMLQTNAFQPQQENDEPFEDYSLFVYRMTAPDFKERVKQLENKLLYPDRENRPGIDGGQRGGAGQEISGRVKDLEAKFKGAHYDKKPKDLLRAIGKIEKTDWNVKQIERKIEENRMGRGSSRRSEKVPKWSKQQFDDKFSAVERKLKARSNDAHSDNKYNEIDTKMSRLEKRIKEGINLEMGRRGANKVSAMAAHLATIHKQPEPQILQVGKPSNTVGIQPSSQGGSELCHFCGKRVYLMERLSAEGKFFHRGCFRCQYCSSSLRLGNYAFDREGQYGSKFYCVQHFGLQNTATTRRLGSVRSEETIRNPVVPITSGSQSPISPTPTSEPQTPKFSQQLSAAATNVSGVLEEELVDVALATPERVEFENLSDCVEVEEDEWTDRNFGLSATDVSDTSQDSGTDSDSDNYAEAEDGGLDPTEETLRLAKDWTRKYGSSYSTDSQEEDSDTETEDDDEDFKKVGNAAHHSDSTGSETEVASDEQSSSSSSEDENSATEISTDSEFEHDGTTHMIPDIVISETVQVKRCHIEQPKHVQIVSSRQLNGKIQPANLDHHSAEKKKPVLNNLINNNNVTKPSLPFINPNRGDYMLNRTQSTEGIASRLSLELKKKYLLGPTTGKSEVRKSGSSSILDTKFKSLIDNISETQKLLNPAPVPSPTMQAFLQGADKLKSSPIKLLEKKELPAEGFKHICCLKPEVFESTKQKEEEEERVRSPVHETSIVVPEFPRSAPKEIEGGREIESDSLSSEISTSTEGEESGKEETPVKSPPKLEIHNSRGELMEDTPEMDSLNMPDICKAENESSPIRDKLDLVQVGPKVITAPTGDLLTQVSTTADLYKDTASGPPSPDSDSLKNDVTVLTETELSDWARDEDGVVSETLDDLEFNINPQYITIRPPKRGMKIAKTEDLEDEYKHICGKANPLDLDNLEFMDTAGESSGSESSGARNKLLLNRGYVQFVNNEDDLTPVAEAVNMLEVLEVEASKEELTDTTTSEPTTVKDSPGEPPLIVQILPALPANFVNARDSLDVFKARIVTEPKGNTLNSPATSRKLEQISQERAKQKDLIHEMVMNKLGRSPREQLQGRSKRSRSRTFSPSTPPQVPQISAENVGLEKAHSEQQIVTKQLDETPKVASPRQRSLTVSSSWRSTETPKPEACSLPDIHKACSGISSESASNTPFRTPLAVPNLRSGLKEQARAKFKMMSDEELGLSPEDKIKKFKIKIQKHLQVTPKHSSSSVSQGDKTDGKKSKEDRKRSIIQAVSDFFHKKSPSPPKTPSSSHSPTKNVSLLNTTKERDSSAPPVPPPPQSYIPSHEDSVSEDDVCDNSTTDNTSLVKRQRVNKRLARLQQSKRLRMAQEVQRELEELEVKQKELEAKGVAVEKALRGEDTGVTGSESELLSEWLRLMRERSEARSKEKILLIRGQEIELEHRHARLQTQLSQLMCSTPDGEKTSEEVALEGRILREMLEIVERRDSLQGQLEGERLRFQEEDKDLEAQMKAKGLQLTTKQ